MFIRQIEKGTYNDEYSFIDRFGYKLYNTELRMGCRAVLCVMNCPDVIIDLIECVMNDSYVVKIKINLENGIYVKDRGCIKIFINR